MKRNPHQKRRHISLTLKLVAWVGLFSALFTLVMTVSLITLSYKEAKALAMEQIKFIANSYSKSMANSLWEIDMPGVQLQLDALSRFPMVEQVLLTTNTGQSFHLSQRRLNRNNPDLHHELFWQERLVSPLYPDRHVGHLTLYVDKAALIAQVRTNALRILGGEIVKGFLVGLLITWMISRLFTRHLSNLARQTAAITPETLDQPIVLLRRASHHADELDQLCDAFNQLHQNLLAHKQREAMHAQLVTEEKLAALGALVAGVAHELNTPLGNSIMMTSALQQSTENLQQKLACQSLRQSDLRQFIDDAKECTTIIMNGLNSSAELVQSFKQVAVDRSNAQRRAFDLQQTLAELVSVMQRDIAHSGHLIELDIPAQICMNSYPGPLIQVIAALIENALVHAFEGRENGQMRLTASCHQADQVQIRFSDNGVGIEEQYLKRIFDPFFTTKMGQGSGGLGMNICYNIVTTLLNGQIKVESTPGQHTVFILDLPLVAPGDPRHGPEHVPN
jgi:signal transduction histidine kinase